MSENLSLEILISTMNRKDLSFVHAIFPVLDLNKYSILVINQTELNQDLKSDTEGIRVINSREFGLSKSRNLGIDNAIGDILVIADDDIEYLPDFDKIIFEAYSTYDKASLISFQFLADKPEYMKKYRLKSGYTRSYKLHLSSIEISFKRKDILLHNLKMNENFGLRSTFYCGEEQIFYHNLLRKRLKVAYVSRPIAIHFGKSTGFNPAKPKFIKSKTAQTYLFYKHWTYLWLLKYVLFLYRKGHVSFLQQIDVYKQGLKGIKEFKNLNHEE
jgi:glycosyltransferase involved in cell wall biosynthesis